MKTKVRPKRKATKKFALKGLTESGRIDYTESVENALLLKLAERGFHGELIAQQTGLTRCQVYTRCKQLGIQLRSYRNGNSVAAQNVLAAEGRILTSSYTSKIVKAALQQLSSTRENVMAEKPLK